MGEVATGVLADEEEEGDVVTAHKNTPDPVDAAAEILNWTGEPGCYSCDVRGPSCLWHGVPDLRTAMRPGFGTVTP